ncbi:MAG: hypothetical protein AABW73_04995 [Nanoarchaeota archaeon]
MIFEDINAWIDAFTTIMNTGLIKNDYVYIDLWSLGHVMMGLILMYLMTNDKVFNKSKTKKLLTILTLAILWEVYEWIFYSRGIFFSADNKTNIIWDIGFDMLGAYFYLVGDKWVNKEVKSLEK